MISPKGIGVLRLRVPHAQVSMDLDHLHPLTRKRILATAACHSDHHRRDWEQVWAFALIGLAGLLLLALFSYHPGNLPRWFPWGSGTSTGSANLVGPIGAILAWGCFQLLGAAAFWGPVALVWAAAAIYFQFPIFRWRTLGAFAVVLLSSACLVQYQSLLLSQWSDWLHLPGKGGAAGEVLGAGLLRNTIGSVGGTLVALCAQILGLIFVVGIHPFELKAYVKRKMAERNLPPPCPEHSTIHPGPIAYYCNVPEHRCLEYAPGRREPLRPRDEGDLEDAETGVVQAEIISAEEEKDEEIAEVSFIDVPAAESDVEPVQAEKAATPNPKEKSTLSLSEILRARESMRAPTPAGGGGDVRISNTPAARGSFKSTEQQFASFVPPGIELLGGNEDNAAPLTDNAEMAETHQIIIDTLKTFGLDVTRGEVTCGPTITRYEIYPAPGLRVKQITALEADLALATRAKTINILAPIPGKDTVGVEIENARKSIVPLRVLLEDPEFKQAGKRIPISLGQDVYGGTIVADLAAMPHLLVAGATGSGKSVCLNCIIASLLFRFKPDELRLVMIDPKVVEMQVYHSLPHLALPVVTDPKRVPMALHWVIDEMERRYQLFAEYGVRKLEEYNKRDLSKPPRPYKLGRGEQMQFDYDHENPENFLLADPDQEADALNGHAGGLEKAEPRRIAERLPYIVVIIDELADLMQTAPADVEAAINRLCQKARAAGIHLIVATQSPRVDVVTGLIKANIPARVAFQVASNADSRVILDKSGAEKLVGKGDMLFQPPDSAIMIRAQGAFVADEEVHDIVAHCSSQALPVFDPCVEESMMSGSGYAEDGESLSQADEETLLRCIDAIRVDKKASASYLQRRLRIGYVRAARMMDLLEERGMVGPADGAKPREIYLETEGVE